ncbi:MAG: beta-lactamase family protein [Flavobacteriales bacterium]|nr:beta-lactamase family protein [Flavobacteriales bacterium]MCB9205046.1 beta-lactamase family protein [Flavobacteriales bacterium]
MNKNRITWGIRIALLIGTVVSLYFVPWIIVKAWILPLPETVQEQVDEAVELGLNGVIVYVDKAGAPPAFYTAGWHDPKAKIPARADAYFKIASISKLYTAVAITKLASSGKLSLDKTVADYFPALKGRIEYADKITVRMLVQHRSGIPNFTDTPDYWAAPKATSEEKLALILDKPANFEPDQDYEYCNTNYLLLAELMDKVLGYPHFDFIQQEILNRLELKNTFRSVTEVDPDDMMSGYHQGHPHDLRSDNIGMVATAEDVGVFLRALNDGTLFDEGENEIYSSVYKYSHSGWVPGYMSFANYYEETDAVVVLFTNTTDRKLYLWNVSELVCGRIGRILQNSV